MLPVVKLNVIIYNISLFGNHAASFCLSFFNDCALSISIDCYDLSTRLFKIVTFAVELRKPFVNSMALFMEPLVLLRLNTSYLI